MDENISYCTAIQTFSFNDGILYTQQHVLVNGVLLCGHRSCKQELFCLLWKKNTSVWKRTNIKCVLYYRWWCNMIWYTAKWYNAVYDTVYQYNIKINQHDIINIYVISYIYIYVTCSNIVLLANHLKWRAFKWIKPSRCSSWPPEITPPGIFRCQMLQWQNAQNTKVFGHIYLTGRLSQLWGLHMAINKNWRPFW